METRGGGVTFYKESHSDELRLFNGGIRSVPAGQHRLEHGRNEVDNHNDYLDYERGTILHSRNPTTRYMDYHNHFGGF